MYPTRFLLVASDPATVEHYLCASLRLSLMADVGSNYRLVARSSVNMLPYLVKSCVCGHLFEMSAE